MGAKPLVGRLGLANAIGVPKMRYKSKDLGLEQGAKPRQGEPT
jgi:hypothetical protein